MGKIENAIEKLNNEIQKKPQDLYIALVGEHLIDCITTETAAEKVLEKGKTLEEALKKIRGNAKEKAVGGCAVIADEEVYKWAREYFGLEAIEAGDVKSANIAEPKKKELHLSLEDFL